MKKLAIAALLTIGVLVPLVDATTTTAGASPPSTPTFNVPTSGATISGTSSEVDVSTSGAVSVSYELDGGPVGYGLNGPIIGSGTNAGIWGWYLYWDTTTVPNGTYAMVAFACSVTGSSCPSGDLSYSSESVTVNNAEPTTSLHYTGNGNFSGSTYLPGAYNFNLADTSSNAQTAALTGGVKGLAFIGTCNGADATFQGAINSYIGDSNLWGFYLMDEPTPPGGDFMGTSCSAGNLKAEADYINGSSGVLPNAKTFIIEQDLNNTANPDYYNGYGPSNTDINYYGLDPYPCRTENTPSGSCNLSWIHLAVAQAESSASGTNFYMQTGNDPGIPQADLVPVYQAFGNWGTGDDGGGNYSVPTAAQTSQIIDTWGLSNNTPSPVFDYAYSWGQQTKNSVTDTALVCTNTANSCLESMVPQAQVFGAHN